LFRPVEIDYYASVAHVYKQGKCRFKREKK